MMDELKIIWTHAAVAYSTHWKDGGKPRKTAVRIAGLWAEI
jgi:hypothetical protein